MSAKFLSIFRNMKNSCLVSLWSSTCHFICYICVCVGGGGEIVHHGCVVCVCVWERERETACVHHDCVRESVCVCERERLCMCASWLCVCERERECVCVCVRERERDCMWAVCICERERERLCATWTCACDTTACVYGACIHDGGGVQTHLRVRNEPVGGRVWIHESSQLQCKVKCSDWLHMLDSCVTVDDSFSWHCYRWYSPLW